MRASTLVGFVAAHEGNGLRPTALCPAYGMAELGLAATLTPTDEDWRERRLSTRALAGGELRGPAPGEVGTDLVSSGLPLAGYRVTVDASPGAVGPLRIDAPSVGTDADTGRSWRAVDGSFVPGDLGFVDGDGWVSVCGRVDDHLVVHGRNVYAPAIEEAVAEVQGLRPGRAVAVGGPSGEWALVAEVVRNETISDADIRSIEQAVRRAAVASVGLRPDEVVLLRPGRLPLTSSGKRQRGEVLRRWVDGSMVDDTV